VTAEKKCGKGAARGTKKLKKKVNRGHRRNGRKERGRTGLELLNTSLKFKQRGDLTEAQKPAARGRGKRRVKSISLQTLKDVAFGGTCNPQVSVRGRYVGKKRGKSKEAGCASQEIKLGKKTGDGAKRRISPGKREGRKGGVELQKGVAMKESYNPKKMWKKRAVHGILRGGKKGQGGGRGIDGSGRW